MRSSETYSTPSQLRFPSIAEFSVRADFEGRALSSDFGGLLCGIDQQIGPIPRLAGATVAIGIPGTSIVSGHSKTSCHPDEFLSTVPSHSPERGYPRYPVWLRGFDPRQQIVFVGIQLSRSLRSVWITVGTARRSRR
jgi:hypothetical protein